MDNRARRRVGIGLLGAGAGTLMLSLGIWLAEPSGQAKGFSLSEFEPAPAGVVSPGARDDRDWATYVWARWDQVVPEIRLDVSQAIWGEESRRASQELRGMPTRAVSLLASARWERRIGSLRDAASYYRRARAGWWSVGLAAAGAAGVVAGLWAFTRRTCRGCGHSLAARFCANCGRPA